MIWRVPGKALTIRIDGRTVALSTSCKVDITLQTISARTKSDAGAVEVADYVAFSASSESLVGQNEDVFQQTFELLMSAMVNKQQVLVEFVLVENATHGIPSSDWEVSTATSMYGFKNYGGYALIKQLSVNAPLGGYATMSVQLSGAEELREV